MMTAACGSAHARAIHPWRLRGRALILPLQSAARLLSATWERTLPAAGFAYTVKPFGGECSDPEISSLVEAARAAGAKAVVGCGGGKVLDTAKAGADLLGTPVVCCPTVASSDAPCSALSVIYTPEGVVERIQCYK